MQFELMMPSNKPEHNNALMTGITTNEKGSCKGELVHSKCQGHCTLRCVDGEVKMNPACVNDICISGCTCPTGLFRDGLK